MFIRKKFALNLFVLLTVIITENECKQSKHKFLPRESHKLPRKDLAESIMTITDMPLDISSVFSDASGVFGKIIGNMLSKKKLVGLNSGWYW